MTECHHSQPSEKKFSQQSIYCSSEGEARARTLSTCRLLGLVGMLGGVKMRVGGEKSERGFVLFSVTTRSILKLDTSLESS